MSKTTNTRALTLDGIAMHLVSGDVCDGNGITQYRGKLSTDHAEHTRRVEELFVAVPRLTNAQIPAAVKRLRAGKPAIDEAAERVAAYRAGVANGTVQPSSPMVHVNADLRAHMVVCRKVRCRICA